jgi:hypothetical protein
MSDPLMANGADVPPANKHEWRAARLTVGQTVASVLLK